MTWDSRLAAHRERLRPVEGALLALAFAAATAAIDGMPARFDYLAAHPPLFVAIPVGLVVGLASWFRQRRPELLLLAALGAYVVLSAWIVVVFAQYTLADRTASWRRVAVASTVAVTVVGLPIWRGGGFDAAIMSVGICVFPALLGLYTGARRRLMAELRQRAERAEREQQQRVLQARSDERAQIARDMHDVVTHRVSLMVLHATALEATKGASAVDMAKQIGAIGREALTELRSLVEVLHTRPEAPLAPQPGLAELETLIADSRSLGTPVTLELTGEHGTTRPPELPALIEHAVYRVVQEALTNVHKHAADAETHVRVHCTRQLLHLTVINRHGIGGNPSGLPSGGHGLLGIAERIRLVGGELTSGPTPDGGFEIAAEIPMDDVPQKQPTHMEARR
ncbi:sensor histidine kinase [Streptomyces sp. NPDC058257]|uniref:sensor histidine kinase n=1 Tax=Streptomyces sp. NPDC058257 TaxID=3346409 RepID=UPI0036E6FD70